MSDVIHFTKSRDATNAAIFKRRSRLTNRKALVNLGTFASEVGLFSHTEDSDSDWDKYEARCLLERTEDDINAESRSKQQVPADVFRSRQDDRITQKAEEASNALPQHNHKPQPDQTANVSNPNSIDYRDPHDFLRTQLIKATIDRDIHKVKFLVEKHKANLFVKDREGCNAFVAALDYGYMEIANYLQGQMQAHGKEAKNLQLKTA